MMEELPPNKKEAESPVGEAEFISNLLASTSTEKILESSRPAKIEKLDQKTRNKIFLVEFGDGGMAIFKPKKGEALEEREQIKAGTYFKRERAAFLVDKFLKFNLVPPTVVRNLGSGYGEGSLQKFIPDTRTGFASNIDIQDTDIFRPQFVKMAILDYVIYNQDRHDGNYLVTYDRLYAVDHGLAFRGTSLSVGRLVSGKSYSVPDEAVNNIKDIVTKPRVAEALRTELMKLLSEEEADACIQRIFYINKFIATSGGQITNISNLPAFLD